MRELPPELAVIYRLTPELLRTSYRNWCGQSFGRQQWACTRPPHDDPTHISMNIRFKINHIWVTHGEARNNS